MGHFQEKQECDLFRLGHVGEAVIAEYVGEIPGFIDDLL